MLIPKKTVNYIAHPKGGGYKLHSGPILFTELPYLNLNWKF